MAYSLTETSKKSKNFATLSKKQMQKPKGDNPQTRTNPNTYAFAHLFRRGWNFLSFPRWMQYTAFSDIFAQKTQINQITSSETAIVRLNETDTWVGSAEIQNVEIKRGYQIFNDGEEELNLVYLGNPLEINDLNWKIRSLTYLYSVPLVQKPLTVEGALDFDNSSQKLRSSGTGSASATTSLVVADGDAPISGVAEKQYLTLIANTTAIDSVSESEIKVQKKYVICDGGQPGCVATGTVLESGSDTGGSTISAGSHLIGGIAVSTDLGPANYATVLNEIRVAILHENGHNGKITCGASLTPANGEQSIALTQAVKGTRGNTFISCTISNITVADFSGGNFGTGVLINGIIGEGTASSWVGGQFVGSADLSPNTSVYIKMNDKPQADNFRIFRDQGPDILDNPLFQNGRPPYNDDQPPIGGEFSEFEYGEYYVQGHWSYYNDGNPDPDYPSSPGDDDYGYYRLWVEGGEWLTFDLSSIGGGTGGLPEGNNGAFCISLTQSQSFFMTNTAHTIFTDNINGTYPSFGTYILNLSNVEAVPITVTFVTYTYGGRSSEFISVTSITANGATLVEGAGDGYVVASNGDITFNKNGSATSTIIISYVKKPHNYVPVFLDIDGEPLQPFFDAVGAFKGPTCCGSYPIKDDDQGDSPDGEYLTIPLMLKYYDYNNDGGEWLPYDTGAVGFSANAPGIVTITSSVVDGTNFPTTSSVVLTLISYDQVTHYYQLSDVDDFDYTSTVSKVNANQTRENFFISLKNAINDVDGHNGKLIATYTSGDTITIKQAENGNEGNTEVVWGGIGSSDMEASGTIVTTGNPDFATGLPEHLFNGRFAGGGDGDSPKWVMWDASRGKYYPMKWYHVNASTGVMTKYDYWEMQDGLIPETLPDAFGSHDTYLINNNYAPIELGEETNQIHIFLPNVNYNYWVLKAVPREEGW